MKFQSNSIFNGTITANSVADAGTNTDKFLVLNSSGVVTYRTAAELYADLGVGSSSAAYTSTLKHQVKAGEAINKGQAVYVSSADGTNMIVTKASNTAESTSSKTIGLLETTLANNGIGNVITEGLLAGLDTTGATNAGDPVWLGTGGNLIYGLINKPYAPANLVFIGIVTRINANNGEIFVKVQNGFELKELHDVDLVTTTPINGHLLGYNGTLWVNKTIAGWLGFTPANAARTLTINGTTYDLSADRSWTINSMVYPGAGIAVSTGTAWGTSITNNSANWDTAYTNRITSLTVTGSSGAATLVSNVLNIPTYTLTGLGGVPTTRSLTINGTAYDLSADRSWTIDSTTASTRTIQKFTATSAQTTFTITGGYTVGMVDVYMNGSKLDNAVDFTASNGTTVVLSIAALTNDIIEVYKFGSQFIPNNALRQVTAFTATAAQTSFTVTYSVGLVDVFYNGAKLAASEYTATSGTAILLGTACQLNDIVEVVAYSYTVGSFTGIGGSGTINTIPKFTASGTIGNSAITDNGTTVTLVSRALAGVTGNFTNTTSGNTFIIGTTYAGGRNIQIGISDGSILPTAAAYINDNTGVGVYIGDNSAATKGLYVKNGGNVGIGTTTPDVTGFGYTTLTIKGGTSSGYAGVLELQTPTTNANNQNLGIMAFLDGTSRNAQIGVQRDSSTSTANMMFYTNAGSGIVERMRINSSGNVNIGTTSANTIIRLLVQGVDATSSNYSAYFQDSSSNALFYVKNDGTSYIKGSVGIGIAPTSRRLSVESSTTPLFLHNTTNASGTYLNIWQLGGSNTDNTSSYYILCDTDYVGVKMVVYGNGNLANVNNSYGAYSDIKLKENIVDATPKLDDLLKVKIRSFNLKGSNIKQIGVVAQELEEVFPSMIEESNDTIKDENGQHIETGEKTKSVKYSVFVPMLIKAMQEQQEMITSLQEQITELKQIVATK